MKKPGRGRTATTTRLRLTTNLVTTSWTNLMTDRQTDGTLPGRQTDVTLETLTGTQTGMQDEVTRTGRQTDTTDAVRVTGGRTDIKETPWIRGATGTTDRRTDIRGTAGVTCGQTDTTGILTGDSRGGVDMAATCTDLHIADNHHRHGNMTKGLTHALRQRTHRVDHRVWWTTEGRRTSNDCQVVCI